ncbi:exporter of polyketide antibiotics [Pseudonocardia petroleophila]|uniref:Polyketide antibiotic transporter n=1 Tax=Pseudonocardia petroleophila TaxID=37331 RepID=A0A7G7MFP6_9PSEU|nr:polyketide antibiotic transporter [Pseudonocardia petroleophila]QNG51607.1 polyketide antibiotic transporter [Pseudonocardia petroleophila]
MTAVAPVTARPVAALATRLVARGAGVVLAVAAGMSALVAATYAEVIASAPGGAGSLAALAGNPAIRTLFGEPVALDDPGGFTVWRTGTVLAVLVVVWAALSATRILRGEEDAGRWDLLLAGRVPVRTVVATHLAVLLGAVTAIGAAVTLALIATGTAPGGAAVHGASLALIGAAAVGTGAVTSQVLPDRGRAAAAAVALLVSGLLARMVADGVPALEWLHWVSPFGLAALARPYGGDRVLPLLVLAAAVAALLAAATALASRRDLHDAPLGTGGPRPPRTRLLGSLPAFAVRRLLRPLVGWTVGIAAFFLLIGLIAESMTTFLTDNPLFAELAAQAGLAELGSVEGYAATLFALLAIPLGGFACARIAGLARAESARHLDLLLAAPRTRRHLLGAETAATAAGAVALTVTAGLATWIGTTVAGAPLAVGAALAGALNTLPVTALGLGAALLALGRAPTLVVPVGMLPTAGGFVLDVVADSVDAPAWVRSPSPFDHLAAVPVEPPDLPAAIAMLGVAAAFALVGTWSHSRRDIG